MICEFFFVFGYLLQRNGAEHVVPYEDFDCRRRKNTLLNNPRDTWCEKHVVLTPFHVFFFLLYHCSISYVSALRFRTCVTSKDRACRRPVEISMDYSQMAAAVTAARSPIHVTVAVTALNNCRKKSMPDFDVLPAISLTPLQCRDARPNKL